ncbi:MAG: formylglycine-generating enzyme family protein [candidate division WOR-3 bacterium]
MKSPIKFFYTFCLFWLIVMCSSKPKTEDKVIKKIMPPPTGMVLIPGGYFIMGSDSIGESPKHKVWIDTLYLDKYEVTNRQYLEFVKATGHPKPAFIKDSCLNNPNQPVVGVSYFDALCYAKWAGKRLPTEAEWEYAARGGLVEKEYPWGDEPPFRKCNYAPEGNFEADGFRYTSPVGKFAPNNFGLYDMAGNVWEWCADFYDTTFYRLSPDKNPTGPDSGYTRVLRGGSWLSINPRHLKCSSRMGLKPFVQDRYYGFRCAKDVRRE